MQYKKTNGISFITTKPQDEPRQQGDFSKWGVEELVALAMFAGFVIWLAMVIMN